MWWNKKFNKWINLCLENPLKTWFEAREYFKIPKCTINFFINPIHNCPYINLNRIAKILDITSCDIMWKDKYNSPRHERSPYIWVCFFKKFGFSLNWHTYYRDEFNMKQIGDIYYWEYLLDYLYYRKSLKSYSVWTGLSLIYKVIDKYTDEENEDTYNPITTVIPVVSMSLNKKGIEKLKTLI